MDNSPAAVLNESRTLLLKDVRKWVTDLACGEFKDNPAQLVPMLLGLIALRLGQMQQTSKTGSAYWRITPVSIPASTATPVKMLEKQTDGLVRTVLLWVDNASGGPTPTIRVSTAKGSTSSGGIRVNAGQSNELGNIPPDVELWAISSTAIQAYVIEYA